MCVWRQFSRADGILREYFLVIEGLGGPTQRDQASLGNVAHGSIEERRENSVVAYSCEAAAPAPTLTERK